VTKRSDVNDRATNDELARRLFQRENRVQAPAAKKENASPEPLASRREPFEAPQSWSLGSSKSQLEPISERERRALFAALNKGTKANLGREPTVGELVQLVQEVDHARALVNSSQDAIQGRTSVFIDEGKVSFRGSIASMQGASRNGKPGTQGAA
jgi:hypothetical protein